MAELHRVLVLEVLELVADRGARLAGDDEFQPLRLRRATTCAVMISTLWPLASLVRNGTSFLSTRAATAWLPTSVCTA